MRDKYNQTKEKRRRKKRKQCLKYNVPSWPSYDPLTATTPPVPKYANYIGWPGLDRFRKILHYYYQGTY